MAHYYLVTMDLGVADRSSPLLPTAELLRLVKQAILPSLEALASLEALGKVRMAGYPEGEQTVMLIVEADSQEQAHEVLKDLPFWGRRRTTVRRMHMIEDLQAPDRPGIP